MAEKIWVSQQRRCRIRVVNGAMVFEVRYDPDGEYVIVTRLMQKGVLRRVVIDPAKNPGLTLDQDNKVVVR